MTTVRRLVAVAAITPIVSVSAVLAAAGPAQAVARLDVPSQVTSNRVVMLSGTVDPFFDAVLFVNGRQVAKGDRKVSYSWDPRDRPNGSYEIKLEQKGKILGGEWHQTSETLMQAVPPTPPSGVAARLQGDHAVVTWTKGAEPDLRGYEISTSRTGKVGSVQVDSACSGGSCRATLSVPAKAAGQRIGFTVQALRDNGNGGTLSSGESAVVSISVPAPRVPQSDQGTDTQGTDTRKSTETRGSADQQDSGRSTTSDQQGQKAGGEKVDKRQSGIQDLPRLPAKKPATTPAESLKTTTAPAPARGRRVSETAGDKDKGKNQKDKAARPPAKRNDKGDNAKGKAKDETEPTPDSRSTGTDAVPATETNITARSSQSPIGGISHYGILIAGALILLLLGAHGGAWFRRKLLTAGTGGAGAMTTAFESAGGHTPETAFKAAGNVGTSASRISSSVRSAPAMSASVTPASSASASPRSASTASASLGSASPASPGSASTASASMTSTSRRPAVILAVVKTRESQPGSAQPASVRPSSVRRVSTHSSVQPLTASYSSTAAQKSSLDHVPDRPDTFSAAGASEPVVASRPELPREALPVAAPIPEVGAVTSISVRAGDRWDDYLPPAPRSMEDSGFWERPQPGATDFWAADEEEDSSSSGGRRNGGG